MFPALHHNTSFRRYSFPNTLETRGLAKDPQVYTNRVVGRLDSGDWGMGIRKNTANSLIEKRYRIDQTSYRLRLKRVINSSCSLRMSARRCLKNLRKTKVLRRLILTSGSLLRKILGSALLKRFVPEKTHGKQAEMGPGVCPQADTTATAISS